MIPSQTVYRSLTWKIQTNDQQKTQHNIKIISLPLMIFHGFFPLSFILIETKNVKQNGTLL